MERAWWQRRPRTARALLAVAVWSLALLAGEAAVRAGGLGPRVSPIFRDSIRLSDHPVLRYELLPGAPDGAATINSDGLRDRERERAKPPGTARIACIGDSICYGYGVTRQEAFPARLETLLNRPQNSETRYETLNLGVTGYSILQAVENLAIKGLPYAPDAVVYAFCLNDVDGYSIELFRLRNQLTAAESDWREALLGRSGSWLARRSRLWSLGVYAWRSVTLEGQAEAPGARGLEWTLAPRDYARDYWSRLYALPDAEARLSAGLDRLAALAAEHRLAALLVIFPVFDDLLDYPCPEVHERVREAAQARGLPVLDLWPLFTERARAGERDLSLDGLHPSARGHALAAEAIARELEGGTPKEGDVMRRGQSRKP